MTQPEYVKGTTPEGEMTALAEAFALCTAAIKAQSDPYEGWQYVKQLGDLIARLRGEQADFRAFMAAIYQDRYGWTNAELAELMGGISLSAVSKALRRARTKGNPVTNPATNKMQTPLLLAVITSDAGVLVANRVDKIPPVTFPGGDMQVGESPAETATRRVLAETGLDITEWELVSQRIHPLTSRHTVYVRAEATEADLKPGDPDDLYDVRWASVAELIELMPTMDGTVRDWLTAWDRGRE